MKHDTFAAHEKAIAEIIAEALDRGSYYDENSQRGSMCFACGYMGESLPNISEVLFEHITKIYQNKGGDRECT